MSDITIFAVGLFTTLLLAGGLVFTVVEFHRMEKRLGEDEMRKSTPGVRGGSHEREVLVPLPEE